MYIPRVTTQRLIHRALTVAIVFAGCGGGGGSGPAEKANASFQLALDAAAVTAPQGAETPLKVTVTRATGFVDAVTVSLSAGVAGIDAGSVVVSGGMTSGWLVLSIAPAVAVGGPVALTITGASGGLTGTKALSLTVGAAKPSSQGMIGAAQAAGTLDAGTALLYRAFATFGDPRLPAIYVGSGASEEDSGLLVDIRAAWATLTPDIQALLLPFTLRPSDPASWSALALGPATMNATAAGLRDIAVVRRAETGAAPAPPQSCAEITAGLAWVSVRSTSFPVRAWVPCSGDPVYDGQSMQMLTETMAVLDKVWQPMGELMGDATGSPILDVDGADEAIDVYIDRGSGVARAGAVNSAGNLGGVAIKDAPHVGKTHSAFILIPELQFGSARFHATVVHELFHVFQFAHNGDIADGAAAAGQTSKYWFYEASATWAAAYFDRTLAPWAETRGAYLVAYGRFVARFQPSPTSLNGATEEKHDYSAFIWPYFLEQDMGGPQVVGQIWTNLGGASNPQQADDTLDAAYPFVTHFREFALRNLNAALVPGDPLPASKRYIARDPDFKDDNKEPPYAVTFPIVDETVTEEFTVGLNPLTARYLKFAVTNKNVKQIAFDLSDFTGWSGLDVDALVKINGTWESTPRNLNGKPKLTFCLDKPEEKVDEVRFILSNHDRLVPQIISTIVGVTATNIGCKGGWTGTSYTSSHETINPTVKCITNDVTWVFDPVESDATNEHYIGQGTVTYSRVYNDGTKIVYTYDPAVGVIDPIMQASEAGMHIRPDPSGTGFIVTGGATTTFSTMESQTINGDPGTTITRPIVVSCHWFASGDMGSKLPAGGTTISDTSNLIGDVHGYSFTKN